MIDSAFKAKWIAALLSGDYEQTIGALRNKRGFCCLGVACDIDDNTRWIFIKDMCIYHYINSFSVPPLEISHKIGLEYEEINELVDMNESGKTFPEIAAWINTNL